MKYILGIDLGKQGGFALISESGEIVMKMAMPIHVDKQIDHYEVEKFFARVMTHAKTRDDVYPVMERVGAIPGVGSSNSMFAFGKGTGYIMGIVHSWFGRVIVEVTPVVWQKWLTDFSGVNQVYLSAVTKTGKKKKDTKQTAINAIQELYPNIDLTKSKQSTVPHDGITDAVGIGLWGIAAGIHCEK